MEFDWLVRRKQMMKLLEIAEDVSLPEKDIANIREYLKHDEWGIALEDLCSAILGEKRYVAKKHYDDIEYLGNLMGLADDLWRDIKVK